MIQTRWASHSSVWCLWSPHLMTDDPFRAMDQPAVNPGTYCRRVKVQILYLCFCVLWHTVPTLCDPMDYTVHVISLGQKTGVSSLSLLQGIFPNQGLNPGLPHCRWILYQSHKGSPRILEWVVYPFSRGSSWPKNQTGVSYIAGRFFTSWAIPDLPYCRQILYCLSNWWGPAPVDPG